MIPSTIVGKKYEAIACNYLKSMNYKIVEKNYSNVLGEIDIISKINDIIVFVEVKYRTSNKFGSPKEAITPDKIKKIRLVATSYLKYKRLLNANVRFDVIEILDDQINHIENCF